MAALDNARSARELSSNSLAPVGRSTSKGPDSSAVSVESNEDLRKSSDGALDRLRSHNSDDGRSDTSRRRMSKLFKGRSKRRKSATSDISQVDPSEDIPPAPSHSSGRNQSDESLGLFKSVASSLLTEDSDEDA
jgi:hypothetical protein